MAYQLAKQQITYPHQSISMYMGLHRVVLSRHVAIGAWGQLLPQFVLCSPKFLCLPPKNCDRLHACIVYYTVSQKKMHQLCSGIAQNYKDRF